VFALGDGTESKVATLRGKRSSKQVLLMVIDGAEEWKGRWS